MPWLVKNLALSLVWIAPYLISGFSAPVIFKLASNPVTGGHFAGALFLTAGAWSLFLAAYHHYAVPIKIFLICVFVAEVIFWGWRFFNVVPLREAKLGGISGGTLHGMMTALYLLTILVLVFSEMRRLISVQP